MGSRMFRTTNIPKDEQLEGYLAAYEAAQTDGGRDTCEVELLGWLRHRQESGPQPVSFERVTWITTQSGTVYQVLRNPNSLDLMRWSPRGQGMCIPDVSFGGQRLTLGVPFAILSKGQIMLCTTPVTHVVVSGEQR